VVGPSLSDDERRLANSRLSVGFVFLVAVSGGLVALTVGGTPVQLAGGVAAGAVLGLLLLLFLRRLGAEFGGAR
jgi:lysozyme family protein